MFYSVLSHINQSTLNRANNQINLGMPPNSQLGSHTISSKVVTYIAGIFVYYKV